MSVIRTLSASESNEQRDREKARLEREYRKSDKRLDELITKNDQALKDVMQVEFEWNTRRVVLYCNKNPHIKSGIIQCCG